MVLLLLASLMLLSTLLQTMLLLLLASILPLPFRRSYPLLLLNFLSVAGVPAVVPAFDPAVAGVLFLLWTLSCRCSILLLPSPLSPYFLSSSGVA
jgi:hypothetical protein